jgi:thiol-disulfide isomerase/thioredoxin
MRERRLSDRRAKKALIIICIIASLIVAAGCSGGSDTPTDTKPTETTPAGGTGTSVGEKKDIPTPSTLKINPVEKSANKYPDEYAVNIEFTPNKDTPSFFVDALKKKKPVFLQFYGENDSLSDVMNAGVDELQQKYKNQVIFILLDADRPQTYGALAEQLPIYYTPQVLVFNNKSTIIRSYQGYIDKDRLEQGIYDAIYRGF